MARIPALTRGELPDEHADLFDVDEDNPDDVTLSAHRVWANNPELLEGWDEWAWTLYDAVGDPRLRELAILAVARALECRYVWHQHVSLAEEAGISRDELLALVDGPVSGFSAAEQSVIAYATAIATDSVDDDVHRSLSRHFDAEFIVAIAFLTSEYAQIATMIDALGIELEDSFVGWIPETDR